MSIPQPCWSKFCQLPETLQFLVTENLGLFGHVKLALVPAEVFGQKYSMPLTTAVSAGQNSLATNKGREVYRVLLRALLRALKLHDVVD